MNTAMDLGSGILNMDLAPVVSEYKAYSLRFIAVYSKNREEYILTDVAAAVYGLVTVAIYDTLGPEAMRHILD